MDDKARRYRTYRIIGIVVDTAAAIILFTVANGAICTTINEIETFCDYSPWGTPRIAVTIFAAWVAAIAMIYRVDWDNL